MGAWRRQAVVAVGGLSLAVGAQCGSGNSGGNGGGIALADLHAQAVAAACEALVGCRFFPDTATCADVLPVVGFGQLAASVAAGQITYDGNAAASCLAAWRNAAGECLGATVQGLGDLERCPGVFKGTLPTGGPCFAASECVSGTCDFTRCGATPGSCCQGSCGADPAVAPLGGACAGLTTVPCVAGSFCNASSLIGPPDHCVATAAVGQTCDQSDGCGAGAGCVYETGATMGMCTKLASEGEPCSFAAVDCGSLRNYCGPGGIGNCLPLIPLGGSCMFDALCVHYARCRGSDVTCVPRALVGERCSASADCLPSLECSPNGLCTKTDDASACP